MLTFPLDYEFHVVGKTTDTEAFVASIAETLHAELGDDAQLQVTVTPRGSKFTKVSVRTIVYNAESITNIYNTLGDLESIVMRF